MPRANTFPAGHLKAACDLVAHHLPPDVKAELISAYEYVIPSREFRQDFEAFGSFSALDVHVKMVQEELAAMAVVETEKGKKKVMKTASQDGTSKKRKTKESHGVEVLKKVNVEGMQKISSFFQKKPKS